MRHRPAACALAFAVTSATPCLANQLACQQMLSAWVSAVRSHEIAAASLRDEQKRLQSQAGFNAQRERRLQEITQKLQEPVPRLQDYVCPEWKKEPSQ